MDYICKYCGKILNNKNALTQHEIRCTKNDAHIDRCQNVTVDDLSEAEKKLLAHYVFLYPDEYKLIYKANVDKYVVMTVSI